MRSNMAGAWFATGHTRTQAEFKLFCFPYAGGTASLYRGWVKPLAALAQVIPVELPGRGTRLKEPPFISMPPLIETLAKAIRPLLDSRYAFFGHSMGAVIGFELAQRLRGEQAAEPEALFISGRRAPQLSDSDPITYNLPKDEFIAELRRLDGTSKEVLEHAELMELILPLLRADFQLIESYEYHGRPPLTCPIIAYGGQQDRESPRDQLRAWQAQTSSNFALHMLPGDHFFIRSSESLLLQSLTRELTGLLR